MQNKYSSVARGKLLNGALKVDPVDGTGQSQIWRSDVALWTTVFRVGIHSLFQRIGRERFLAKAHEHDVNGHAMQPGGEGRFTTKGADLAEELKKGLLHEIFGIRRIVDHSQTESVDATAMQLIKKVESGRIPRLSAADGLRFCPRNRFGWSWSGQQSNSGAVSSSDAPSPLQSCPKNRRR